MIHTQTPATPMPAGHSATCGWDGRTGSCATPMGCAARHGSLDGFRIDCSCGWYATNTIRTNVEADGRQHTEWHRADEARARRRQRATIRRYNGDRS